MVHPDDTPFAMNDNEPSPGAGDSEMRPIKARVTCLICGAFDLVEPSVWVDLHIWMRTHVREEHPVAVTNLLGEGVHHGYGWTDDQVAVRLLYTDAEIAMARRSTEDLLREGKIGGA